MKNRHQDMESIMVSWQENEQEHERSRRGSI